MMKRFALAFALIAILLLSACGRDYDGKVKGETDKEVPNLDTGGTVLYIVNTSSRSYHLSSCYMVKSIKEENKQETYDIDFLIEREYSPCKICINKKA